MSLSFDCTRLLTNIVFGFALTHLFSLQMRFTTNDCAQTRPHSVIHSTTASFFQLHKTLLKKCASLRQADKKNCPKISFYRSVFFNKCHNICCKFRLSPRSNRRCGKCIAQVFLSGDNVHLEN